MMNRELVGHSLVGRGPCGVLVLHGWFGDSNVFEPLFPFLDADAFTYAFMDCRGYGRSRALPGPHTIDQVAQDAVSLADYLGWPRFSIVGHSMGGKAAQRVNALVPSRVRCFAGIAPVPASGMSFDTSFQQLFDRAAGEDAARRTIIDATTGQRLSTRWLDWMVRCSRESSDERAFASYLQSWCRDDFSSSMIGSTTSALVLLGQHDPAITEALVRQTFASWYSEVAIKTIANSGHYPMLETPVVLVTLIEQFLRKHV